MAIVRGFGFTVNAGPDRCWMRELAWDETLGLDRLIPTTEVRVLGECEQPPVSTWLGSGICGDHLMVQLQRSTS